MNAKRLPLVAMLLGQLLLGAGCTTELWEKDRFAHYHHPANDAEVRFFYSYNRQDILVDYKETRDAGDVARDRAYWLDENQRRIDRAHKPRFASSSEIRGLTAIPIVPGPIGPNAPAPGDLYAMVSTNGCFWIYSGHKELFNGKLPGYYDRFKQTVARLVFTPATVTADVTAVAAITSPYWAPYVAAGLLHASYTPPPPPPRH